MAWRGTTAPVQINPNRWKPGHFAHQQLARAYSGQTISQKISLYNTTIEATCPLTALPIEPLDVLIEPVSGIGAGLTFDVTSRTRCLDSRVREHERHLGPVPLSGIRSDSTCTFG